MFNIVNYDISKIIDIDNIEKIRYIVVKYYNSKKVFKKIRILPSLSQKAFSIKGISSIAIVKIKYLNKTKVITDIFNEHLPNYIQNIQNIVDHPKTSSLQSGLWMWNDDSNEKPVEMTVALPALNANKIIWLALESLKNQTNITFAWELIVFEEEGFSKKIVQSYSGLLPGCVRIIYKTITKEDAYYCINDIKKSKCTSYYTLLEKWINMAKIADENSKIFVKHAADCYSPPNRLFIHYENFKNDMCYYSTQPKGYFYNIKLKKYFLYNGINIEPYNWKSWYRTRKLTYQDNNIFNWNIIFRGCHLNMALKTKIMKKIPLPYKPLRAGLDGYILYQMTKITSKNPEVEKIIFTDDEVDKDNWKFSLDTDSFNNISMSRSNAYTYYDKKHKPHCIPVKEKDINENVIPDYIMKKLELMSFD